MNALNQPRRPDDAPNILPMPQKSVWQHLQSWMARFRFGRSPGVPKSYAAILHIAQENAAMRRANEQRIPETQLRLHHPPEIRANVDPLPSVTFSHDQKAMDAALSRIMVDDQNETIVIRLPRS